MADVRQCAGDAGFLCDKSNVLRVMIKEQFVPLSQSTNWAKRLHWRWSPPRTHVRTAASPPAKSLRTHRDNSPETPVTRSARPALGEQDSQGVWQERTGQPRCEALGEQENQGVWLWENRKTNVCGYGTTGQPRCVSLGEQDSQDVWLWEYRKTNVCGSGRTGQPRRVALGEQDNQSVWLWENRKTNVCGSGRTGQPRPFYPFRLLFLLPFRLSVSLLTIAPTAFLSPSIYLFPPYRPLFSFLLSASQFNFPTAHQIKFSN